MAIGAEGTGCPLATGRRHPVRLGAMCVAVALPEIPDQVGRFGPVAFLVTVGDDGRPHPASACVVTAGDDGTLRCGAGRRTSANVSRVPP